MLTRRSFAALFIISTILLISTLADSQSSTAAIYSISTVPNNSSYEYRQGSIEGGTYLYIKGSGFSTTSSSANKVRIGNLSCPVIPYLTTATQIVCEVPPGKEDIPYDVSIEVNGKVIAAAPNTYIDFSYENSSTPQLEYLIPTAGTPGEEIQHYGIQRVDSSLGVDFLKIGGHRCDSTRQNEFNILEFRQDSKVTLPCNVPIMEAGYYNATQRNFNNSGNAKKLTTLPVNRFNGNPYDFAVVPRIDSISSNKGSSEGQVITIKGEGFSLSNNEVNLGSTQCKVLSQSTEEIECELQAKKEGSVESHHAGFKWEFYENTKSIEAVKKGDVNATWTKTRMTLETPKDSQGPYVEKLSGYFKAPTEGGYKFYTSGSEEVEVYISKTAGDKSKIEKIAGIKNGSPYKFYFAEKSQISESITLEKGKLYYIEVYHKAMENSNNFVTVGVQIPKAENTVNLTPQVQSAKIACDLEKEVIEFTISNAESGEWRIRFDYTRDDGTLVKSVETKELPHDASAEAVQDSLTNDAGFKTEVIRKLLTKDDAATEDMKKAKTVIYTVTFLSPRDNNHEPVLEKKNLKAKKGTEIDIDVEIIVEPSQPLHGDFEINYKNFNHTLSYDIPAEVLETMLKEQVDYFTPIKVYRTGDPIFGAEWIIQFSGEPAGEEKSITFVQSKLTGCKETPKVEITTLQKGSKDLFYEVIPFDLLFTASEGSQLTVKSNGVTATCPNFNCGYILQESDIPTIKSFSYDAGTLKITLESIAITKPSKDNTRVFFGGSECVTDTVTLTESNAEVTAKCQALEAGEYYPRVYFSGLGYGKITSGLAKTTIKLDVSSITPVNPNGGNILKISGSGFPASLQVAIENGFAVEIGGKQCEISSVTSTNIECIAPTAKAEDKLVVKLGDKKSEEKPLQLLTTVPVITEITPSSGSPAASTEVTITGTGFDADAQQTTVLVKSTENSNSYNCEITSANATHVICKVPIIPAGKYAIIVQTSQGYTESKPFEVKTEITSVTPQKGSSVGGTVLTIEGSGFSTDPKQMEVLVGTDKIPCDVLESFANKITCQTRPGSDAIIDKDQEVAVTVLKNSKSQCKEASKCTFMYSKEATPTVMLLSTKEIISGKDLQVSGAQIGSDTESKVLIDGRECLIINRTATDVNFKLPDDFIPLKEHYELVVNVPGRGNAKFEGVDNKVKVFMTLDSVTPKVGPKEGVLLTLARAGLQNAIAVKVGESNCEIRFINQTHIICKATSEGPVSVDFKDVTNITCQDCTVTLNESQLFTITEVSPEKPEKAESFELKVKGTHFPPLGPLEVRLVPKMNPSGVSFLGQTKSATETEITAIFTNIAAGEHIVEVSTGPNVTVATQLVTVPLSVGVPAIVESSIAGGAVLKISGAGFYNNENKNKNQVSICGLPCEVTESSETSITCKTPRLVNSAVKAAYPSISKPSIIKPSATWSDSNKDDKVFDLDLTTVYKPESMECEIGLDIGTGLVADVSEIKFFPGSSSIPTETLERLSGTVIEGSNDNKAYTLIATLDENTHEGWNTLRVENKDSPIRYRYFRVKGSPQGKCYFAELQLFGVVLSDNQGTDLEAINCKARVTVNGQAQETADTSVTYKKSKTAEVKSITPTMGSTASGTPITVYGTGFVKENTKVYIDDAECTVDFVDDTHIECKTGPAPELSKRRSSLNSEVKVLITGNGYAVINSTVRYDYIDKWSDVKTWGTSIPSEGENVTIPANQTVLLDISPVKLGIITVEGALIFNDTDIDLHCDNIVVLGGRLQIGTTENPITKNITVTLYGSKESTQLQDFGNKGIIVKNGVLDIHGKERSHAWTLLSATANKGDSFILVKEKVDWKKGEQIVIASTEHDPYQSEIRIIVEAIQDETKQDTKITFNEPLKYKHFGETRTINDHQFELRAEVGLLTRNVVVQGDENSEKSMYGCHITTYSTTGDESSIGRISFAEIRRAGQAENIGRHPIQFNLIGNVKESFVIGNSVHNTYNRAINIHGAHFLKVQKNVAYWVLGHAIFTEDGIETNNVIEDNLAINTISSNALLHTDQSPASFWITNPNNIVRRNHAAGSDRYGFWYDMKLFSEGASATNTICPSGQKLGEFTQNEAHSNSEDGLKISSEFIPRKFPCLPYENIEMNPPIPTQFDNFLSWKNKGDAVVAEKLGAVVLKNIKAIDNIRAGIEISDITKVAPGAKKTIYVEDAWIIGILDSENVPATRDSRGLVTPRADRFGVKNINFVNLEHNMTAIETCSHCEYLISADEGARTNFFEGLKFTNVTQKVRFNTPYKEILVDEDGSLTKKEGGAGVTCYCEHMDVPGCEHNNKEFNGLVCDKSVSVRRIVFENVLPADEFRKKNMLVSRIGEDGKQGNPSVIAPELRLNFENSWAVPFATGYTYNVSWENQKDFESIIVKPSELYSDTDKAITLVFNHTEYREVFEVLSIEEEHQGLIPNMTSLWENKADTNCSQWHHDPKSKHLYLAVSGKERKSVEITAYNCKDNCIVEEEAIAKENFERLWSNKTQWPNGELPKDGDDVEINPSWNVLLDTNTSCLGTLTIKGDLRFNASDNETVLTAQRIWVKGQLIIGNSTDRYLSKARISLTGKSDSKDLKLGSLNAGKKVLAVTGNLSIYGAEVTGVYTYLEDPVKEGDTEIKVPKDSKWKAGDEIFIAPSQMNPNESETRTIKEIKDGVITLDKALEYDHFGAKDVTKKTEHGTIDMRAEVGLLTRNIVIEGSSEDNLGGRLYVGHIYNEQTEVSSKGKVELDGVEMKNLGQQGGLAGVTFENVIEGEKYHSIITRSVVRDSLGWIMKFVKAGGALVEQNIFYKSVKHQVVFEHDNSHIKFLKNLLAGNGAEAKTEDEDKETFSAALYVQGHIKESEISGNTVAGCAGHCIIADGGDCSPEKKSTLKNNIAHSGETGWLVTSSGTCISISDFVGYKLEAGIQSYFTTNEIQTSKVAISDCHIGIMTNTAGIQSTEHEISLKDSYFGGLLLGSGAYANNVEECRNLTAVYLPVSTVKGKTVPPKEESLPWRKIDSNHVWKSTFTVENVVFENYKSDLIENCGDMMHLFRNNDAASDASASTVVSKIKLNQVGDLNKVFFDPEWEDLEDCGGIQCTGIKNIVIRDLDGSLTGKKATSIVPDNKVVRGFKNCEHSKSQNAYICKGNGWGLLTFESLDDDASTLLLSPVSVYRENLDTKEEENNDNKGDENAGVDDEDDSDYVNVLNSYMDHGGQMERLSRFHAIVETGDLYKVKFEGELPDRLHWQLQGSQADESIQVEFTYSDATSVRVANQKNDKLPLWQKTKDTVELKECGDFIYDGENSTVIIKLTGAEDCLVRVDAVSSLQGRFNYSLSYDDFVKNKGSENFKKAIKGILEVEEELIRITKVQDNLIEFLVDVPDWNITADDIEAVIKETLDNMLNKLNEKVTPGDFEILGSAVTGSAFKLMFVNPVESDIGPDSGSENEPDAGPDDSGVDDGIPDETDKTIIEEEDELSDAGYIKGVVFMIGCATVLIGLYFCCLLGKSSKSSAPRNFEMVSQDEHVIEMPTDSSMSQSAIRGKNNVPRQRYHAD